MSGLKNIIQPKFELNNCSIRLIGYADIEILRKWKNVNRRYFFYKDKITKVQQDRWYQQYLEQDDNWLFIIEYKGKRIGCIGFRATDVIDIYNVILAGKRFSRKGIMSYALRFIVRFAINLYRLPVTVKVLIDNPAVKFYQKNYFKITDVYDGYVLMRLDVERFEAI